MKKEIPILFSTPMVQAILAGRKTQTRRIVKGIALDWLAPDMFSPSYVAMPENGLCPYGKPGDLIYVRETLYQDGELGLYYVADNEPILEETLPEDYTVYRNYAHCKVPNIHMQKSVARIWLEVTDVRVERLHDISEADAKAEGTIIRGFPYDTYTSSFCDLWQSINGPESWRANPWVWVVSFKVLSTTGKPLLNSEQDVKGNDTTEDASNSNAD